MATIVALHSYGGGTGKTHSAANLAALMAMVGLRVAVVDLDVSSPALHLLFRLPDALVSRGLRDYLVGDCDIEDAVYDVSAQLGSPPGAVFVVPSKISAERILDLLHRRYDVGLLGDGFARLIEVLHLDVLLLDAPAGTSDETMLALTVADVLAVVLRASRQEHPGTQLVIALARRLGVPRVVLLVNMVPPEADPGEVRALAEQACGTEVAALLPHCRGMAELDEAGMFVLAHPEHEVTRQYRRLVATLLGRP